jgi:hypothetical protein
MNTDILHLPISQLSANPSFCIQCEHMGFYRLKDIVDLPLAKILSREHFSYGWLGELTVLLNEHGLLSLLQPIPGKIYG